MSINATVAALGKPVEVRDAVRARYAAGSGGGLLHQARLGRVRVISWV